MLKIRLYARNGGTVCVCAGSLDLIASSCTSAVKCFVCPVDFCSVCVPNGAD